MKICNKCHIAKSYAKFSVNNDAKDHYHYFCKECTRSYTRDYYQKNKDKIIKSNREWQQRNFKYMQEYQKIYREKHKEYFTQYQKIYRKKSNNRIRYKSILK
jgi:hypothetical protein